MEHTPTITILLRRAVALIAAVAFLLGGGITHLHAGTDEVEPCCGNAGIHATNSDEGEPSPGRHDGNDQGGDPHCGCACHALLTIPDSPAPTVVASRDQAKMACAYVDHLGDSPAFGIFQPPRRAA